MGEVERVPERFDPDAHPSLIGLGTRLRVMAGDAAFTAGRDYLRRGLVRHGTVAGTTAHAAVAGSTDYRIAIAFGSELAEPKVTCTCPAHRRNKHCKHVVAVVLGLLERPGEFAPVEPVELPTEPKEQKRAKRATGGKGGSAKERAAAERASHQATGLAVVDRLLEELAGGGQASLGTEGAALLAEAAETVRALKLRRLGNDLMALQRLAVAGQSGVGPGSMAAGAQALAFAQGIAPGFRPTKAMRRTLAQSDGADDGSDAARFADLLIDVARVRQALGARDDGAVVLDPALAEELLGKTWREADLERVVGLDLFPVAEDRSDDGEFKVETSYLLDLGAGAIYAEKQIAPRALRAAPPKERRRLRLLVDEAGLYPGEPPRRIKLLRTRRAALTGADVDRLLGHAVDDVATLRARLIDQLRSPFGPPEATVLFRPAALVRDGNQLGALDVAGRFLALGETGRLAKELPSILPDPGQYAIFGLLTPDDGPSGVALGCRSVVGHLRWGSGPVWPDVAK